MYLVFLKTDDRQTDRLIHDTLNVYAIPCIIYTNLWFYCFQNFILFGFPILQFLADEGYTRNESCALNLISAF